MSYALGIDLGTTFSAAAVATEGRVEVINLGTRSAQIPSVVFIAPNGEALVGDTAEGRAATDPTRVAREFKRRLGDTTPLFLGGAPFSAEVLSAELLGAIYRRVCERTGGTPTHVVVTHPAAYSQYRLDLLRSAIIQAGIGPADLVAEPTAAALHYAATATVAVDEVVAVYDFGGGTFDTTLLRRTAGGFDLIGEAQGLERLGGVDFDAAVLQYINDQLGGKLNELDPSDPTVAAQLARIRSDARSAKEALSETTTTSVPIVLPGLSLQVQITRHDLEAMVRPRLAETVQALNRAAASAGITIDQIGRILLVGGSSRIPLIRQQIAITTGRPVTADIDPEFAVALGAAREAARRAARPVAPPAEQPRASSSPQAAVASIAASASIAITSTPTPTPTPPPPPEIAAPPSATNAHQGFVATLPVVSPGRDPRRLLLLGAAALTIFSLIIAGVIVLTSRGDDKAGVAETADTGLSGTSGVAATLPNTLPARVFWAGFEISNESLVYDLATTSATWTAQWHNLGPGQAGVSGTELNLRLGDQTFTSRVQDTHNFPVDEPHSIDVIFTDVPATASFTSPSVLIGAADQHQSTLVLDKQTSSSDFLATVKVAKTLDLGDGVTLTIDNVLLAPASCKFEGDTIAFGPTSDPRTLALLVGTIKVSNDSSGLGFGAQIFGIVEENSFDAVNPLADITVGDRGTSRPVTLCFDMLPPSQSVFSSNDYFLKIETTRLVGDPDDHVLAIRVPFIPADPCTLLTSDTIGSTLGVTVTSPPLGVTNENSGLLPGQSRVCRWDVDSPAHLPATLLLADVVADFGTDPSAAFAQATAGSDPVFTPFSGPGDAAAFGVDSLGVSQLVVQNGDQISLLQGPTGTVTKEQLIALMSTVIKASKE